MTPSKFAIGFLLAVGLLSGAIASIGVLTAANVYQRLHNMGIAATVGVAAIVAAVVVREGVSQIGIKALLVGIILLFMNPILTHATARAARVHEHGKWEPGKGERVEKETA